MKAVRLHGYGGPEALVYEDAPTPETGEGQVLVRVRAAGVNPSDAKVREGGAFASMCKDPFPRIPGWDVSGVVSLVGGGVTGFKPGDAVYGMVNFPYGGGAYAEYVVAPAEQIAPKPDRLDHIQSASLPLAVLTAWQALFDSARLSGGERVLIHAAAGGVGHLAVQLARWKGAGRIIATASSGDREYLESIGVDEVIDYRTERFEDMVEDVDIVLDCVGGQVQERSWRVLKKGGHLVTIMEEPPEGRASSLGVSAGRVFVRPDGAQLKEVASVVDRGLLSPHIYRVFPLEKARQAHELVEKGQTRGKIVLDVAD